MRRLQLAAFVLFSCLAGVVQAYRPLDNQVVTATASSEHAAHVSPLRVIDESGLSDDLHDNHGGGATMWLTDSTAAPSSANGSTETGPAWIAFEFDQAYQLGSLWVWNFNQYGPGWDATGRGLRNVSIEYTSDGATWQKLGDFVFNEAPGTPDYAHNTEINLGDIVVKELVITAHTTDGCWGDGTIGYGLSEVRFFALISQVSEFSPINDARGVDPDVTLNWLEGERVAAANGNAVYFGDDYAAVRDADTTDTSGVFKGLQTAASYTPGTLEDGKTYYWRVDQHNSAYPESPWTGPVCSFTVGLPQYRFDGAISRDVLENFIARSITLGDFCRPGGSDINAAFDEDRRMIRNIGVKFICRAAIHWDVPHSPTDYDMADENYFFETIAQYAAKMTAEDPEAILQGTIFETAYSANSPETPDRMAMGFSGAGVEQTPIPAWVFEEFALPVETRNFSYEDMIYADGSFRNHWLPGASVPDVSRQETKLWFYYLARRYIDAGFESLHFGQMLLMAGNDPGYVHWSDVLDRIRAYAAQHARRHFVVCDGHAGTGLKDASGNLLLDLHLFPLRPKEQCGTPYETILEIDWIDSIYAKSQGGITPSGWVCESLPFNVEFDNSGAHNPGVCGGPNSHWPWGWDEICWFSHCSMDYRNDWLEYATNWLKSHDAMGYVRVPGRITIAPDPIDDIWDYRVHMPTAVFPDAFGQEDTIKRLWAQQYLKDMSGISVIESHYDSASMPLSQAQDNDTMQLAIQSGAADLSVDSVSYGTIGCIADSSAGLPGGLGVGFPDDNANFVYGDLDVKFNGGYVGGRTLKDITVYIAPTSDGRRFYNLTFSYSTVDDPCTFVPFARATAFDGQAVASGYGSVIEISDTGSGCVTDVDTLRITAGVDREPGGDPHYATAFMEIDVNMYSKSDFTYDGKVTMPDFAVLVADWLGTSDVEILNGSFEMPDINNGRVQTIVLDNWTKTGIVKLYDPSAAQWASLYDPDQTIPDGEQVLFATDGTLAQDTGQAIVEDSRYELSVSFGASLTSSGVGARLKLVAFDGYEETDLVTLDASEGIYTNNDGLYAGEFLSPPLVKGKWVTQSVSWDSSAAPHLVGQELRVYVGGASIHVDDVRLSRSDRVADLDGDGVVGILDLQAWTGAWLGD